MEREYLLALAVVLFCAIGVTESAAEPLNKAKAQSGNPALSVKSGASGQASSAKKGTPKTKTIIRTGPIPDVIYSHAGP